jgi:hypothetical protein
VVRLVDQCPPPPQNCTGHHTRVSNTGWHVDRCFKHLPGKQTGASKTGLAGPVTVDQHPLNTGQMRRLVLQSPQHPSTGTTGAHQNTNLPIQTKNFKTGTRAQMFSTKAKPPTPTSFQEHGPSTRVVFAKHRHQFTIQLMQSKTPVGLLCTVVSKTPFY